MEKGEKQQAEARKLASQIKAPLLTELKSLLASGDKLAAIKKYRDATGADLTTAHSVIELLASPKK
jgi:ribosomal protein L7/L12